MKFSLKCKLLKSSVTVWYFSLEYVFSNLKSTNVRILKQSLKYGQNPDQLLNCLFPHSMLMIAKWGSTNCKMMHNLALCYPF